MNAPNVDVPRLIRVATLLFAILGAALVYCAEEPHVQAAALRLDDDRADARSVDVAFASMPRLEIERARLARGFDATYVHNPEAEFLRELAATVRRHGVTLLSTNVTPSQSGRSVMVSTPQVRRELFVRTAVTLEMSGTYAHLLAALRDLSTGSAIVSVAQPAMRRDAEGVVATIPITIFEPRMAAP